MSEKIEPFVNEDLLKLVREAKKKTTSVASISIKDLENEKARHLSELYRIVSNYDEDELMVCAAAMLEMNDGIYPSVQRAERKDLIRKGKRKDEAD